MKNIFYLILLTLSLTLAQLPVFGEKSNIAIGKKVYDGRNFAQVSSVTDGKYKTGINIGNSDIYIVDLNDILYIEKIDLVITNEGNSLSANPITLQISEDIINWRTVKTNTVYQDGLISLTLNNVAGRYIKLVFNTPSSLTLQEVEVTREENYNLAIKKIDVTKVTPTTAVINCNTNKLCRAQIVYEEEESFLYYSRLSSVALEVKAAQEHHILLTDLSPQTTYRYQIIVDGFQGKKKKSKVLGFTTKGK